MSERTFFKILGGFSVEMHAPQPTNPDARPEIIDIAFIDRGVGVLLVDPGSDGLMYEVRVSNGESEGLLVAVGWHVDEGCNSDCSEPLGCDVAYSGMRKEAASVADAIAFALDHQAARPTSGPSGGGR